MLSIDLTQPNPAHIQALALITHTSPQTLGIGFNSWTENATRLGMRIQETLAEHTKELTGSCAGYYDTGEDKTKNIRAQLDSGSDRKKLGAMKRLIAMISKGRNVSEYFSQVVKNVVASNIEVRKLVYIYLLRYADAEPDLALLSINTFQHYLTDSSPLIRTMALRVLSGIRVLTIAGLIILAIKKCAADMSPYVHMAAALSIPKCYSLDESQLPSLIKILSTLLRDRSLLSVVLSVSRTFYYLALSSRHHKIVHPLLRILAVSPEIERVVLTYVLSISHTSPVHPFYDSTQVTDTKMRLLRNFVTVDNYQALLREFMDYTDDVDETLVAGVIQGIGHIARNLPESTAQCLNALMACIESPHDPVVDS
ncbi:adaptin N terminal region-domain-containing protein [Lactarius quietus]|nr:adaptin N terminal region-domain-containing protein [Lactarius quietus]